MTDRIEAGTIIAGTLRSEDLLEAFSRELRQRVAELIASSSELRRHTALVSRLRGVSPTLRVITTTMIRRHTQLISEAECRVSNYGSNYVQEIVNELQDALNEYAPDGMYFGTLEGDGADFGWWYVE